MVLIKTLVDLGYVCPNCGSQSLRGSYHDWVNLGTMICGSCGLRWHEDIDLNQFERRMLQIAECCQTNHDRDGKDRFIFVIHTADNPLNPLLNASSSDGQGLKKFKESGYKYLSSVSSKTKEIES